MSDAHLGLSGRRRGVVVDQREQLQRLVGSVADGSHGIVGVRGECERSADGDCAVWEHDLDQQGDVSGKGQVVSTGLAELKVGERIHAVDPHGHRRIGQRGRERRQVRHPNPGICLCQSRFVGIGEEQDDGYDYGQGEKQGPRSYDQTFHRGLLSLLKR